MIPPPPRLESATPPPPAGADSAVAHTGAGPLAGPVEWVRRRRTWLDWLGENPYIALTTVVHVVLFIGLFSLVIEPAEQQRQREKAEVLFGIEAALNDDRRDTTEDAASGALSPVVKSTPLSGLAHDADAARNQAAQARSPQPPTHRDPSTTGQAPTLSPIRSAGLGQVLDGSGMVTGTGTTGQGNTLGGGYGLRNADGRGSGIRMYGGNAKSESAVDAGLKWLAAHQFQDEQTRKGAAPIKIGYWRPMEFNKDARDANGVATQCVCGDGDNARAATDEYRIGTTALALLAFLGAGHKPNEGEYGELIERTVNWLLLQQEPAGRFGNMYNTALATLGLSETLLLAKQESLRKPVTAAANYIAQVQARHGGWDYEARRTVQRSDSSISSWCLMALKSARAAGVEVPRLVWLRAIHHFKRMTTADGDTQYGDVFADDWRYGGGMVATGLFCRLMLGADHDDEMTRKQAARLLGYLPNGAKLDTYDSNYYVWYVGTLAAFFYGGPTWTQWNSVTRDTAIRLQRTDTHRRGSWDAYDRWSWAGGRIYSTALMVLTLEVYYRYVPEYVLSDAATLAKFWDRDRLYTALGEDLDKEPPTPKYK